MDPKGANRVVLKETSDKMTEVSLIKSDNEKASTPVRSTLSQADENSRNNTTPTASGRPKKTKDPEKDAKVKQRPIHLL